MLPGLIDHRNAPLFEELEQDFEIKIELVQNTDQYGCYSKDHRSTIFVPESKISAASFTHELLHRRCVVLLPAGGLSSESSVLGTSPVMLSRQTESTMYNSPPEFVPE